MNTRATIVVSGSPEDQPHARSFEHSVAALAAHSTGARVVLTPPVYHLPENSPAWETLAGIREPVVIVSRMHPRPAALLMRKHLPAAEPIHAVDLATFETPEECVAAICELLGLPQSEHRFPCDPETLEAPTEDRWYPVVDRERCTDCQHCLQFCLFGVHQIGPDGHMVVAHPDNCKHGCPACSRICPKGAIIFPLYDKDPAIAGAPGLTMQPDEAARRMFYTRTGQTCPVCGATAQAVANGLNVARPRTSLETCSECGRPRFGAAAPSAPTPVHAEIDALLDDLDRLSSGN